MDKIPQKTVQYRRTSGTMNHGQQRHHKQSLNRDNNKHGGDELMRVVLQLYSIMSTGEILQKWKSRITMPIHRKSEEKIQVIIEI